jgi:hypothetical protein
MKLTDDLEQAIIRCGATLEEVGAEFPQPLRGGRHQRGLE